jgi:hypothetical protein
LVDVDAVPARQFLVAIRCAQEVREFQPGPDTAATLREAEADGEPPGDPETRFCD